MNWKGIFSCLVVTLFTVGTLGCGRHKSLSGLQESSQGVTCRPEVQLEITYEVSGEVKKTTRKFFEDESTTFTDAAESYRSAIASVPGRLVTAQRTQGVSCKQSGAPLMLTGYLAEQEQNSSTLDMSVCSGGGCKSEPVGNGGIKYTCPDGSSAVYIPSQNTVAVNPESGRVSEHLAFQATVVSGMLADANMAINAIGNANGKAFILKADEFKELIARIESGDGGLPLPEIKVLIDQLGIEPPSLSTSDLLAKNYQFQMGRLGSFAKISNKFSLSPDQARSFHKTFVEGAERLDRSAVVNTAQSRAFMLKELNSIIAQRASLDPNSPSFRQRIAAYDALLDGFAPNGVVRYPGNVELDRELADIEFETVFDGTQEERMIGIGARSGFNEAIYNLQFQPSGISAGQSGLYKELTGTALTLSLLADSNAANGDVAQGFSLMRHADQILKYLKTTADIGIGFIPVVGDARDVMEVISGRDLLNGEQLTNAGRVLTAVGVVVGSGVAWRNAGKLLGISSVTKQADEIVDGSLDAIKSIGQKKYREILRTENGFRPDPSTYLPAKFIDDHLAKFDEGASFAIKKSTLETYGRNLIGNTDNTRFIMPKSEMDDMVKKSNGDLTKIEGFLGFEPGSLLGEQLIRIDVPSPRNFNLRMPSGNEKGANVLWLPGGRLPTGYDEAVMDRVPLGSYIERSLFE